MRGEHGSFCDDSHGDEEYNMQTIYIAAQVIMKSIANFTKVGTKGTNASGIHDVPAELYMAIRWIIMGPADSLETKKRAKVLDRAALTVSQNIMYGFKCNRQVKYKPIRELAAFRLKHARDKTVDVKETKDLYGRLMVLARSSRDINQKEAIGNHEFTVTPRALFASDGTILPCLDKSKLIHLLNKLATAETPQLDQQPEDRMDTTPDAPSRKKALVDGMVLLQKMAKN